jgi:hypothetical protein
MRPALALALLGALVLAPSAEAYKRQNYKFPSRTITYYDATGSRYKKEVAAAATAWNKSGVKVRWVKTSKSRARVPIRVSSKIPAAGLAWYYGNGRGLIELQPTLKKGQLTKAAGAGVATQVIVHEMGHVMGLDHVTNTCAIMQPVLGGGCKQAPEIWQFRCRLLEKDDLRGGVALFGGKVGKVGPEFCDAVPAPAAVSGLAVEAAPSGEDGVSGVNVTWTTPKGKELESVRILRKRDTCPKGPEDRDADNVGFETANPGQAQSTIDQIGFPAGGRYCYAAIVYGKFSRPGKMATAFYDHTGPPSQDFRPQANFEWTPDEDGTTVRFSDFSEVNEGAIVSWHWDFADGQFSTDPNPIHQFEPGRDYSVTLTVTDDQGRTDSETRVVSVVAEPVDTGGGR